MDHVTPPPIELSSLEFATGLLCHLIEQLPDSTLVLNQADIDTMSGKDYAIIREVLSASNEIRFTAVKR